MRLLRAVALLPILASAATIRISLQQSPFITDETNEVCNCSNTSPGPPTDPPTICNDKRLGPVHLPDKLPLLSFVSNYDRFGSLTPGAFLGTWTHSNGSWLYPPHDGFSLNDTGHPIKGNMTLAVGTKVDRFGSEGGRYVSAADAPFNQRSLPPNNLNPDPRNLSIPHNYHAYTVVQPLRVVGGPIAPWFGQPGLGAQFFLGANNSVASLVEEGILERLHKRDIEPGAGHGKRCGQ